MLFKHHLQTDKELFCELPAYSQPRLSTGSFQQRYNLKLVESLEAHWPYEKYRITWKEWENEREEARKVMEPVLNKLLKETYQDMEAWILERLEQHAPVREFPDASILIGKNNALGGNLYFDYFAEIEKQGLIQLKDRQENIRMFHKLLRPFKGFMKNLLLTLLFGGIIWLLSRDHMALFCTIMRESLDEIAENPGHKLGTVIIFGTLGIKALCYIYRLLKHAWALFFPQRIRQAFRRSFEQNGPILYRYLRFCDWWSDSSEVNRRHISKGLRNMCGEFDEWLGIYLSM